MQNEENEDIFIENVPQMCYSLCEVISMDISEKLRRLREENDLTQAEFGKIVGASNRTVSQWENGTRTPRLKYVGMLCNHFGIDMYAFIDQENEIYSKKTQMQHARNLPIDVTKLKKIPVLGRIAAGVPIYAEENIEGYTYTDLNGGHEYFGLKVRGDSMDAAGIKDNYTVVVRRQDVVENGQIAVCLIDGEEATLKRFSQDGNIVTLMPQSTNPVHKPFVYNLNETSVTILGLVVEVKFSVE